MARFTETVPLLDIGRGIVKIESGARKRVLSGVLGELMVATELWGHGVGLAG